MLIPAAVVLYMIISTLIRILTHNLMFITGVSDPTKHGAKASTHRAEIEKSTRTAPIDPSRRDSGCQSVERSVAKGSSEQTGPQ